MSIIGIPIGLYGYLFPGNINLMVVELYSAKKFRLLFVILTLVVIFESIYCGISLRFLKAIQRNDTFYKSVEVISYVLILIMGLWMIAEKRPTKNSIHQNTIIRGVFSIVIHPQQVPFWLVTGVLVNKALQFDINNGVLSLFVLYNAVGTLLAMITYMIVGKKILHYFKLTIPGINKIMGTAYIVLAMYQLFSS